MPRLMDEQGKPCEADDPKRLIWYGPCMFWTDDWGQIADHGIPRCPTCGAPGFQITAGEWMEGAERFEAGGKDGNTPWPRYVEFLLSQKEVCHNRAFYLDDYHTWIAENSKPWPSDATMVIASRKGTENRDKMTDPVERVCRDCGCELAVDTVTIAKADEICPGRKIGFFCIECCITYDRSSVNVLRDCRSEL